VVTNLYGSTTSSPPATLTVNATNAAEIVTMSVQEPSGNDWDIGAPTAGANTNWSDFNPASYSAAAFPGSTYKVLAGARLRSPDGPVVATFPGNVLSVEGDAVWNVNPAVGATIGEIRFKQHTYGTQNGLVNIKKLVMNGGQLDVGNDGLLLVGGEIDILANTPFNNDSAADRGYRINAWLTGSGSIEYHGYATTFQSAFTNNLNIAGTTNTFSGSWNVVTGTLLGTGANALGTNSIFVGANGALETTYDLKNTNGYLVLNGGRMYLHQTDVFRTAIINGTQLTAGTYTFSALNTSFPTNFPATWPAQNGAASFSAGSGSIIISSNVAPVITVQPQSMTNGFTQTAQLSVTVLGGVPLVYQWRAGAVGSGIFTNLSNAGNISGATNATLTITNLGAANGGDYIVVVTNSFGAVTSIVARITVIDPFITQQPQPAAQRR